MILPSPVHISRIRMFRALFSGGVTSMTYAKADERREKVPPVTVSANPAIIHVHTGSVNIAVSRSGNKIKKLKIIHTGCIPTASQFLRCRSHAQCSEKLHPEVSKMVTPVGVMNGRTHFDFNYDYGNDEKIQHAHVLIVISPLIPVGCCWL